MRAVAIVMAAGTSSRMGENKLKLKIGEVPVYRYILDVLESCGFFEVVVSASDDEILEYAAKKGYNAVKNKNPNAGQGYSIHIATSAAVPADYYMYFVADQPMLRADVIRRIMASVKDSSHIVIPRCGGKNCNPVAFGADYRKELENIIGDNGGRAVIRNHSDAVKYVDFDGEYIDFFDMDKPEDYLYLKEYGHVE